VSDTSNQNGIYGNVKEIVPNNQLELLSRHVTMSHWLDANLPHCILDLVYKSSIDWFSKKQATVGTPTYWSEFVAAARTHVKKSVHYLSIQNQEEGLQCSVTMNPTCQQFNQAPEATQ